MRTLLILTCCLALTAALGAENQPNNKNKKDKASVKSHNRNSLGTEMKMTENTSNSSQNQGKSKDATSRNNPQAKSVDSTNANAPRSKAKSKEGELKVSKLAVKEKESDDSTTEKVSLPSKPTPKSTTAARVDKLEKPSYTIVGIDEKKGTLTIRDDQTLKIVRGEVRDPALARKFKVGQKVPAASISRVLRALGEMRQEGAAKKGF